MKCPPSGQSFDTRAGRRTPSSIWIARNSGFLVSLMGYGMRTDGSVHAHQLKSLDWAARQAVFVEKVPVAVMQEVLECLVAVFEDE